MSDILFSTEAFLQFLGIDPAVAFWTMIGIVFVLFVLALFYGASPRRSYCVEDEIADDQEQLDYLDKWSRK